MIVSATEHEMRTAPRAWLLSTAAIGWGLLREWWWIGILLAIVIEAPRFLSGRKEFKAPDYLRAFNLSFLLMAVVAIILWAQDVEREQYEVIVEALPLFFLPVLLCQRFAVRPDYPIHASTLMTYWRFQKDGDQRKEWRINFGYLYLVLTMISASWNLETLVLKGGFALLVALLLWRLLFAGKKSTLNQNLSYVAVLLLSATSMYGLMRFYAYIESGKWYSLMKNSTDTPAQTTTKLGTLGKIIQDPKIHWRIIAPETAPPALLRDRVFNRYINRSWYHDPVSNQTVREEDYEDLATKLFQENLAFYVDDTMAEQEVLDKTYQKLRIRGKAREKTLIPVSNSTLLVDTLSVEAIEYNSLGSYVATNPSTGVLDYECYSQKDRQLDLTEFSPNMEKDLFIPEALEESLSNFLEQEGIVGEVTQLEATQLFKKIFQEDFSYSTEVTVEGVYPLKRFLLDHKSGHCEYFATAGAMLLRKLGVPARYVVGYAVREYDDKRQEWIMRGLHAHAWVRVWSKEKQRWLDIDFTPRGDNLFGAPEPPSYQSMMDAILRWREDLVVWRADNAESWIFTVLPWFLVLILIFVFGRNLLKASSQHNTKLDQVLAGLSRKPVGLASRPISMPHESWLQQLPDDITGKSDLIQLVEEHLYSDSDDISIIDIKKRVKSIQQEMKRELPKQPS